jgi:hydroxymethylbilane synthase
MRKIQCPREEKYMANSSLIIATRKSPLALWQAHWVKARLEEKHPGLSIQLLGLTTRGDTIQDVPLLKAGGKSLFVKELEEALLEGRADMAVHSMKDVPMTLPLGLCLPVMCMREDPRDAFVSNQYASFEDLPKGSLIGTSSLRRQSQLLALRPDIKTVHLRGNVNTRLMRLDQAEYEGIILAAAGLVRLNAANRIRSYLSVEQSLPAAGQGALGIECRENDLITQKWIAPLNHRDSFICVTAERAMCQRLGGGCHVPVAAYAKMVEDKLQLQGLAASPDGKVVLRAMRIDTVKNAEILGEAVANDLLQQGAAAVLSGA